MAYQTRDRAPLLDTRTQATIEKRGRELLGLAFIVAGGLAALMLATYSPDDPNWMVASDAPASNALGRFGASIAHPLIMIVGRAAWGLPLVLAGWGLRLSMHRAEERARAVFAPILIAVLAAACATLTPGPEWTSGFGLGGLFGDTALGFALTVLPVGGGMLTLLLGLASLALSLFVLGFTRPELTALRQHATRALVLGYAGVLTLAERGARAGLAGAGAAHARGREHMAQRRARVAAERALIEEEARALRAVPEPSTPRPPTMPGIPAPRTDARETPRAAIMRTGSATPRPHVMPPVAAYRADPEPDHHGGHPAIDQAPDHAPDYAPDHTTFLAAPARLMDPSPQAGFLAAILRRARGDTEAAADAPQASAAEADRIRARIGDAIRARAQGPEMMPEPAFEGASGVVSQAVRAARNAWRAEPPMARMEPATAPSPAQPRAFVPPAPAVIEFDTPEFDEPATDAPGNDVVEAGRPNLDLYAPDLDEQDPDDADVEFDFTAADGFDVIEALPPPVPPRIAPPATPRAPLVATRVVPVADLPAYAPPPLELLTDPAGIVRHHLSDEALAKNARDLERVLDDFGVKGEIVAVRPGPVVTMYELEPAPGLKASRVIGLADDIARNMKALSARVSTIPGRNVIGIELPNEKREKVVLREILSARDYGDVQMRLPLALGKDIGGEPVVANLAKMPHLLIAGTTGSGKSVAINTMILSLLYKLTPEECRLIMIDPKMLELSVYDGIPHLLSPVVTDPRKAVVALKWVVGEMEERYKKMSKTGVRNIEGYNGRVREALARGEMFSRTVQTGFDDETGDPVFETDEFAPEVLPFIVVFVDEMADLMMVAGKEIEICIQRLAQMARASGIHLIMATQRPSVDVITGTIKANFPTRISFQVTSKIDSRTILGEQGAEQLLGQGDMLYMAGGGRITRIHGPFCSDEEVEEIVTFLKGFGPPSYVGAVLEEQPDDGGPDLAPPTGSETEDALYDMAVAIVAKDRKCSTSYIQRKLAIGYNKAARLVEQMEDQGVVTPANHVGKREILIPEAH